MTKAESIVRETLAACLPAGVPLSFSAIVRAQCTGSGREQVITADLTMFDGAPATVALRPWAFGWSHQFTDMAGGAASFENGLWQRVPELSSGRDQSRAGE